MAFGLVVPIPPKIISGSRSVPKSVPNLQDAHTEQIVLNPLHLARMDKQKGLTPFGFINDACNEGDLLKMRPLQQDVELISACLGNSCATRPESGS